MAKVGVSLSWTLQVRPGSTEHARFGIEISEIDTDAPIEPQLQKAYSSLNQTAVWVEHALTQQVQAAGLLPPATVPDSWRTQ